LSRILRGAGSDQGRRRRLFRGLLNLRLHLFILSFGWDFDDDIFHRAGGSRFWRSYLGALLAFLGFGRLFLICFLVVVGWRWFDKVGSISRVTHGIISFAIFLVVVVIAVLLQFKNVYYIYWTGRTSMIITDYYLFLTKA
jgi:hypothetical protein